MHLLNNKIARIILLSVLVVLLITAIAVSEKNRMQVQTDSSSSPEAFLKLYNLKVQKNPEKFKIDIPKDWNVKAGEYPEGLYWRLANVFSKDAGLDLEKLKGTTVDVWRYSLTGGLPGTGDNSKFKYPSTVVLLVKSDKVVGAWLNFNMQNLGPSVKKRYIKDITGLDYEKWADKEGIFSDMGKNGDLPGLEPVGLVKAYFKAINDSDKTRANACLTYSEMLGSLTSNLKGSQLYNPGFCTDNSLTENISKAEAISFKFLDPENPGTELKNIGNRTQIEIALTADIKWSSGEIPDSDGVQMRFISAKKYSNGWRIEGFGTGP